MAFLGRSVVENTKLPAPYTWGKWSGAYRHIERDGRVIAAVGGVHALVTSAGNLDGEAVRAIIKGERERAWDDGDMISIEDAIARFKEITSNGR